MRYANAMPAEPINVSLTDGEKLEALKALRHRYGQEIEELERELRGLMIRQAESEFLAQYVGEQREVVEMRPDAAELEKLEKRRQHVTMLIERLDSVLPKQGESGPSLIQRF